MTSTGAGMLMTPEERYVRSTTCSDTLGFVVPGCNTRVRLLTI